MKTFTNIFSVNILLGFGIMSACSTIISTPYKRSAAAIENDLVAVKTELTSYDNQLQLFSGTLAQALSLHQIGTVALGAFNATILDATATASLSSIDATTIEQSVASIQPILVDICDRIINAFVLQAATPAVLTTVPIISGSAPLGTPTPGGPVPPVHPFKRQTLPSPIGLLRNDLLAFVNAYKEILNLLGGASPVNITAEFTTLGTRFTSACPTTTFFAV